VAEPKNVPDNASDSGGLTDALRRYVDAVVGVTEVSRERAERIMSDLAKRGQSRTKDLQKAARELADRSSKNRNELMRLIQKEIGRQIGALGLATNDEVEKLRKRVRELEKGRTTAPKTPKRSSTGTKKQRT
jgi:polyhydroxyalkanoate synthesis regulator phasin